MYDSIDNLPIMIWDKISKTGNTMLLYGTNRNSTKHKLFKKWFLKKANKTWIDIYDEFIMEFGISDKYRKIVELRIEGYDLILQCYKTGNKTLRTLANIKLQEALDIENEIIKNDKSLTKVCKELSENMGFRVDPSKITVIEYYNYING